MVIPPGVEEGARMQVRGEGNSDSLRCAYLVLILNLLMKLLGPLSSFMECYFLLLLPSHSQVYLAPVVE